MKKIHMENRNNKISFRTMMKVMKLFLLMSSTWMLQAQDNLDPAFGVGGMVNYQKQANITVENVVGSVINQSTGKIYVAGSFTEAGITNPFIISYNLDGSRNMAFGPNSDGVLFFSSDKVINAIDINTATGDLVVAGYGILGVKYPWLAYISSNGSSTTIGDYTTINPIEDAQYNSVKFTSGGNIVAAGEATVSGFKSMLVSKLMTNLVEDIGFENFGHFIDNTNSYNTYTTATAISGDTLFVAGYEDGITKDTMIIQKFIVEGPGLGFDPSFNGGNPVQYIPTSNGEARPAGIAILPGDKMVIPVVINSSGSNQLVLVGYNTDGSSDVTFGISGNRPVGWGEELVVQDIKYIPSENRIAMSGYLTISGDRNQVGMVYSINGNNDLGSTSFDGGGTLEYAEDILFDPVSNKYYLVGGVMGTLNTDILISRTDQNMQSDGFFGPGGFIVDYFYDSDEFFYDIQALADGALVLAKINSGTSKQGVFKFNTNGQLDLTYGNQGFLELPLVDPTDDHRCMTVTSGGQTLVAGKSPKSLYHQLYVHKLNATGQVVTSFGTGGVAIHNYNDSITDVMDIEEMPNGKILVSATYIGNDSKEYIMIIRLNADGSIDLSFNTTGYLLTSIELDDWDKADLLIDPIDPVKVLCVTTEGPSNNRSIKVFKISETGGLVTTFATAGIFTTNLGAVELYATHADIDPAGNIYIGAINNSGSVYTANVIKLDKDGTLQTSFGASGVLVVPTSPSLGAAMSVKVTGQNLYILGADNTVVTMSKSDLNGVLETSFGTSGTMIIGSIDSESITSLKMSADATDGLYIGSYITTPKSKDLIISKFLYTTTSGGGGGTLPTGITLADVNKVFGDAPFTVTANSASPEPITYSVVSGCLSYNSDLDQFEITCAGTATIRASQPANATYEAGSVDATVTIAKGTPTIAFNNQGAVVGDAPFRLLFTSNSDTSLAVFSTTSNSAFTISSGGVVTILAAGSELVTVTIPATQDYVDITASAMFTVYTTPVPPDILPTTVQSVVGDTVRIDLKEILVGNSSPVDLTTIDLDPNTPGVQNFFATPSEGFYSVDTNGILTFIPIYGFTGIADLEVVVSDSRGETSAVSTLRFNVELPSKEAIPELETKEIFTPNGDGYNDAFVIAFLDNTLENKLVIYDRNGTEVYTVENYNNDWTGFDSKGKKLDSGIYYYMFSDELNRVTKGAIVIKH